MPLEFACGIMVRNDRLLLGRRSDHRKRDPGRWDVIGGRVEPGETVTQALEREFREELGVTPTAFSFIETLQEPRVAELGQRAYHLFAVTGWDGGEPVMNNDEHSQIGWLSLAEAETLDLTQTTYPTVFRKALARAQEN